MHEKRRVRVKYRVVKIAIELLNLHSKSDFLPCRMHLQRLQILRNVYTGAEDIRTWTGIHRWNAGQDGVDSWMPSAIFAGGDCGASQCRGVLHRRTDRGLSARWQAALRYTWHHRHRRKCAANCRYVQVNNRRQRGLFKTPTFQLNDNILLITDHVRGEGNANGRVRLSVRPFVSILSFEPSDLWTWVFLGT